MADKGYPGGQYPPPQYPPQGYPPQNSGYYSPQPPMQQGGKYFDFLVIKFEIKIQINLFFILFYYQDIILHLHLKL